MVIKGYIIELPEPGDNHFQVRIPFIEDNTGIEVIMTALLCSQPGSYGGYDIGDCVFVSFEGDKHIDDEPITDVPVIMGKLYKDGIEEVHNNCVLESLTVTDNASLPGSTKFGTHSANELFELTQNVNYLNNNVDELKKEISELIEASKEFVPADLYLYVDEKLAEVKSLFQAKLDELDHKIEELPTESKVKTLIKEATDPIDEEIYNLVNEQVAIESSVGTLQTDVGILQQKTSLITVSDGKVIIDGDVEINGDLFVSGDLTVDGEIINNPTYPVKGDVIALNMDGSVKNYRVLRIDGSIAEVLSQFSAVSKALTSSGNIYENGPLDTYLNDTTSSDSWYYSLTEVAKAAIVQKAIYQDAWSNGTSGISSYAATQGTGTSYTLSLNNESYGNRLLRYAYALSIQDIVDYLEATPQMTSENTTINKENLQTMFNTSSNYVRIRSAVNGGTSAFILYGSTGNIAQYDPTSARSVYAAFQVDLSKITWIKM